MSEGTVTFQLIKSHVSSDLDEYYQLEAWSKDVGPYAGLFSNGPAWRPFGLASETREGLADQLAKAWDLYGKVRIRHVVNEVIEVERP